MTSGFLFEIPLVIGCVHIALENLDLLKIMVHFVPW